MIGTNADEGIFSFFGELANPNLWEDIRNDADTIMPLMLFGLEPSEVTDLDRQRANQLVEFYIGSSENINEEHKQEMIDMMTDSIFLYGTHRTIKHMVNFGKQIFQYVLTYQGRFSLANVFGIPTMGVCHADDLQYLFDPLGNTDSYFGVTRYSFFSIVAKDSFSNWILAFFNISWQNPLTHLFFKYIDFIGYLIGWELQPLNEEEIALRNTMVLAWTNFAKYGDPTPPDSGLTPWDPIIADKEPLFWNILGPEPLMAFSPYINRRMEKWEEVLGVSNDTKSVSMIYKFSQKVDNKQNKDCLENWEDCQVDEDCCNLNCLTFENSHSQNYSVCYTEWN